MSRLEDLLEESAGRYGDKPAFIKGQAVTSYRELLQRARSLGAALRAWGVQPGDRVALLFDADVDYLVAFYGILSADAVAVPLCPDTRTGPLVYALGHSGARAVLIDASNLRWLSGQAEQLPELRLVVVRGQGELAEPGHLVQRDYAEACAGSPELGPRVRSPQEMAAIVYTSGTTGRPKGVMLSHRNLVANIRSIVSYLSLSERDVAGMTLPFYYVYGNSVLHTHLAVGGTVAHVGSMTFPAQVLDGLARLGCTGFSGVPATFARLLGFRSLPDYDLSRLRYVTQAGAAMAPELAARLSTALPQAQVFVMYGQTEAAARLAYLPPEMLQAKLGSAGRAIPGVTLRICDAEGNELPRGSLGEVVAQGENVMLGYYNDPEATARVLRPEGLRTGDLGTMDEDGYLFLQGRESEMIKSGGHRISPLEIEQALTKAEGVQEVAVSGVPDPQLGEAIAAFVVPEAGATLTKRGLLDVCFLELPRFKMPGHLIVVPDLPRGATGKVLRRALKEWFAEGRGTRL